VTALLGYPRGYGGRLDVRAPAAVGFQGVNELDDTGLAEMQHFDMK
jgi:hypothetical protein